MVPGVPRTLRYKDNITAWEATISFLCSLRPKNNRTLKPSLARKRTWFMMHNLKPSAILSVENRVAVVENVSSPNWKQSYIPKFPQTIRSDLDKYWGCAIDGVSHDQFRKKQYGKHGRHYKLRDGLYWRRGLSSVGRVYVMRRSIHELMTKMKMKGYRPGFVYNCRKFADDLRDALGHPVAVLFKDLPEGGGLKYLHEISILFRLDFGLYMAARREKFGEADFFHFEDFSRRRKKVFNLFALKAGLSSRYFKKLRS